MDFFKQGLKQFIIDWDCRHPVDKWWREKHNIIFDSEEHRKISFIQMYIEYSEFFYFSYFPRIRKKIQDKKCKQETEKNKKYEKGNGNFMKEVSLNKHDIDIAFNELDIDDL